jgi:hypothetical protein
LRKAGAEKPEQKREGRLNRRSSPIFQNKLLEVSADLFSKITNNIRNLEQALTISHQ